MLKVLLKTGLTLLRHGIVLPWPSITTSSLDNIESFPDLFSVPYGGIRNPMNAAILFADCGDYLIPEETVKA
jgi:hypothetical protein